MRPSLATTASASRNSACICVVKLFNRSGRSSVIRATPLAVSNRICS